MALALISGCAHDASAELSTLRGELKAEREKNARLSSRLERLEAEAAVRNARSKKEPVDAATPELSVVKLKPKAAPAPKIDTSVDVVEPAEDVVEQIGNKDSEEALTFKDEDAATPALDEEIIEAEFDQALSAMKVGNIEGGITKLVTFANNHGRHPKADNALYFAGVGMMGQDRFDEAAKVFDQIMDSYPAGDATVDSMLKLAECRMKLNQTADAKALYARVVESYPGTPAANAAQARLSSLPRAVKEK